MNNYLKKNRIFLLILIAGSFLSACGSNSSSSIPTSVPSSVTIFYAHNLVFRNSTTLSTGYNGFGQLGTGDLGSRTVAGALSSYYSFTGSATGGNHSLAFFNNSTVHSWGYNGFGQLGNASTTYSSVPVKAVAISGVTAVTAGAYHSLAMKNDDTIWAWGSNAMGQLGVGSTLVPAFSSTPVKVTSATVGVPFTHISSIAANGYHSIARANGLVWAWGYNGSGQLGINPATTGALAAPMPVAGLPSVGVTGIAAGGAFNYAVGTNGTLYSWGNNDNGQLGNGTTVSSYSPVQVMKSATTPLTNVVQAAGGIQHGLARLGDGTVWAWGYNFFGQLGNNGKLDSSYAVQVLKDVSGNPLTGVTDIRAFGSSSMAKVGGVWYVWGDNAYGQLGLGLSASQATTVPIPARMSGF
jgi:alpha-tubulin suppressor-like RCC1 family protein